MNQQKRSDWICSMLGILLIGMSLGAIMAGLFFIHGSGSAMFNITEAQAGEDSAVTEEGHDGSGKERDRKLQAAIRYHGPGYEYFLKPHGEEVVFLRNGKLRRAYTEAFEQWYAQQQLRQQQG